MVESLRILMKGIVDYAGLFPPARLSMPEAAALYLNHKTSPDARVLSHFVCPVAKLPDLEKAMAGAPPITVSVLGTGGADPHTWIEQTAADLEFCSRLEEKHAGAIRFEAFEAPLPESVRMAPDDSPVRDWILELHQVMARFQTSIKQVFLETPPGMREGEKIRWLFSILGLSELKERPVLGVKLRTGGLEPKAFPTPKQVAAFISAAWKSDLIFKCTAGLHHPFRHMNTDLGCEMHGFLNVFSGAALLASGNLNVDDLESLLADMDPNSFSFDDHGLSWKGHTCALDTLKATRTAFAISFGSCNFQEPLDDLSSHHLL